MNDPAQLASQVTAGSVSDDLQATIWSIFPDAPAKDINDCAEHVRVVRAWDRAGGNDPSRDSLL